MGLRQAGGRSWVQESTQLTYLDEEKLWLFSCLIPGVLLTLACSCWHSINVKAHATIDANATGKKLLTAEVFCFVFGARSNALPFVSRGNLVNRALQRPMAFDIAWCLSFPSVSAYAAPLITSSKRASK